MLSARLIQTIEDHSDQITRQVLQQVRRHTGLPSFGKLPDSELLRRFDDVCRKLGQWLAENDEQILGKRYGSLGWERFEEGIPLHEVVLAAQLFKQALIDYAKAHAFAQTAFEIYAEEELECLIERFFDQVIYHVVRGYEAALRESILGLHETRKKH